MIRVTQRPSDPEFDRFGDWQQRASAARDRLISAWIEAGRPVSWNAPIDRQLYKEFRDVFLHRAFHLKCAYCECKLGHNFAVQVEHYRPKGCLTDAGDTGHPGYFWLAYEWWNLLPTCNNCNTWHTDPLSGQRSAAKSTAFPIQGTRVSAPSEQPDQWQAELAAEDPLLLNPYFHEPDEHIDFDCETGVPIHTTPSGQTTIDLCDLRRQSLCERRLEKGREMEVSIVLGLFRDQASLDSLVPPACEYSLWIKRLVQNRLTKACVRAGMAEPERVRQSGHVS
jgi:hypothetical protein